ncbi:hypothetical protein C440_07442 [Haloferax mucosum ATCC BAA-1512]|uniref:PD(D/E)XK endonuclease domain-containing protein n=1 Tax=Haloferax mucosum ATCC BAA-1512 TaxID=662479 RepID=M0IDP7_9EURY|nr:hypothetical protein [Haloferax mucosum]ELZ94891.1 hypothetical protein C440_07442 [Haloferax mucosum ATCC BAA-1512]
MPTNRSKKAARYGALAERAARERYGLEMEHTSWYDAKTSDGTPVEIKAAMLNRASGKTGRFRVFKRYHKKLIDEGGVYVFVCYTARGRGIRIARMRTVDASCLRLKFYGAGGHRESNQAKIPPEKIF